MLEPSFAQGIAAAASPNAGTGHHSPPPCPSAPRYARPESHGCCCDSHRDLSKGERAVQCTVFSKHTTGLIGCRALGCACVSTFRQAMARLQLPRLGADNPSGGFPFSPKRSCCSLAQKALQKRRRHNVLRNRYANSSLPKCPF